MSILHKNRNLLILIIAIVVIGLTIFALFVFQGKQYKEQKSVTKEVFEALYPVPEEGFEDLFQPYTDEPIEGPTIYIADEANREDVTNIAKIISEPVVLEPSIKIEYIGDKNSAKNKSDLPQFDLLEDFKK